VALRRRRKESPFERVDDSWSGPLEAQKALLPRLGPFERGVENREESDLTP